MLLSSLSFCWADGLDGHHASNLVRVSRVTCKGRIWSHLFSFYERNWTCRSFLLSQFSSRIWRCLCHREKKKAREEEKARFLLLSPISFSWVPCSALLQNISEVSQIIFTPYKELHVHDEGGQSLILRGDCRDCRTTKCHLRQKSLS